MGHMKKFKGLFESIPEFRKIVLLMFSIKSVNLLMECDFLQNVIIRLFKEFKN